MRSRYPKNIIVGFSVVAALLTATVLLGGYAISKPADTEEPAKVGCCPAMGNTAACPHMAAMQAESTGCTKTPCTESCTKPCCAGENAEGACDKPCTIPCPKTCCKEDEKRNCCGKAETEGCCAAEVTEQ